MKVLQFNRKKKEDEVFVSLVKSWWLVKTNFEIPELFMTDYGFMAFSGDRPICAVFFHPISGCDSCMWALHSSSPDSSKEERKEAIKVLCKYIEELAKSLGFKAIVGYPKMESITDRMVENGFVITESGANQCVKYIGG